jgi:hypothetical protein
MGCDNANHPQRGKENSHENRRHFFQFCFKFKRMARQRQHFACNMADRRLAALQKYCAEQLIRQESLYSTKLVTGR